jgi:hypothetical protein
MRGSGIAESSDSRTSPLLDFVFISNGPTNAST